MNLEETNDETPRPARILRRFLSVVLFLCGSVYLGLLCVRFESSRRSTRRDVEKLENTRNELRSLASRLDTSGKQAEADKQVVLNLLRLCRSADDIPDLGGHRILSYQGFEQVCLYVPQGSHTLEINSSWKPTPPKNATENVDQDEAGFTGEKSWRVPLLPTSGYRLSLATDRKAGPMVWNLTGNHPDFKAQQETIPLEGFSHRGSSWSTSDVAVFPNQIDRFAINHQQNLGVRAGVQIMKATLNGPIADQQHEVTFSVRVLSDSPACVAASEAVWLIYAKQEDRLLPYEGGGKYNIKAPQE